MSTQWFHDQFKKWNFNPEQWFMAHEQVAKIKCIPHFDHQPGDGKIILVTAMSPTPYGEGKTTTVIGLTDALNKLNKNAIATLRQPSVGPVFGKKGGATGGGKASVIPHDRIDLGLTGDFYAIENANNMMAALIDNHMYFYQDPTLTSVIWRRCLDMNDRTLRSFNAREGKRGFVITAASELMAILSLSRNFKELKEKIGQCILALDSNGELIKAKDLDFHKAAAVLLRDAFYPNLVRTMEDAPVIMHAGPFANIAQGTSSVVGTKLASHLGQFVITEAGFGAELGAEKFFNIKCRTAGFDVAMSVLVATTRAIEMHGIENLYIHIENLKAFGPQVIVCLNKFEHDSWEELNQIKNELNQKGILCEIGDGFAQGGEGMLKLATIISQEAKPTAIQYTYQPDQSIEDKIANVAKNIYRAKTVAWSHKAKEKLALFSDYSNLPICMAKSPLSLNDQGSVHIRDIKLQAGAGFIVPLTGDIRLLPGLPKSPRALNVDLDDSGNILWN